MEYFAFLTGIHPCDRMTAGSKGANLGELVRAGLPVPPGFVVLTPAYVQFIAANGLQARIEQLASTVLPGEPATADEASQAIQELFKQGTLPAEIAVAVRDAYQQLGSPAVAVRSSATDEDLPGNSFAGLQDTFLHITTVEEVLSALKRCWASLWSARALIYRARQQIVPQTMRMAVIVQEMVNASAAGILFTCNPVTGARDEMVLNASWGLGEAIVSGQVTPDTLILDKHSGQSKSVVVATKLFMTVPASSGGVITQEVAPPLLQQAVLSDTQVAHLFQLGLAVEKLFNAPQDIEWASTDEQRIVLLQARPVTTQPGRQTITVRQEDLPVPGDDSWDGPATLEKHPYDLWTRTNMGENMPDPVTPLTATLWPTFFLLGRLPSKAERIANTPPLPKFDRFYGRIYVNEGNVIHMAIEYGIPTSFLDSTWGSSGRGLRSSDDAIHFFHLLRRLPKIIASVRQANKEQAKKQPSTPTQPEKKQKQPRLSPEQLFALVDQWVDEFQHLDLSQLDDESLWSYVPLWIERDKALSPILLTAGLAGIFFYFLERRLSKWTGTKGQASVLVQALSGIYTAEVGTMLWQMARTLHGLQLAEVVQHYPAGEALALLRARPDAQPFIDEFEAFLQRHGYRCPNDAEMYNPRWSEQPEQVIEMLKQYLRLEESTDPTLLEQQRRQEREETTQRIRNRLNPLQRVLFRWLLKQAQEKMRLRDNNRSYVAKFLFPMRLLFAELGRRWTARGWLSDPGAIFFLTLYELNDMLGTQPFATPGETLIAQTVARQAAFDYWHTISAPSALDPDGVPLSPPQPAGSYLQGLPASSGRIRGIARVIGNVHEAAKLTQGEILVTQATDPGWTPVFPLVGGLVLETGGLLSHGAIIAREYGIPAVINVPGAVNLIQDGQIIEVDGTNGRVYLDGISD